MWETALHLFRGVNTTKLIYSLLHSTDAILKVYQNNCIRGSEYIYSSHLMTMDTCKPAVGEDSLNDKLPHHSPLKENFWSQELASYTDHCYIAYLLKGTTNRSRIGFNRRCSLYSCSDNMPINNLTIVSEYLQWEVQLGRMCRQ